MNTTNITRDTPKKIEKLYAHYQALNAYEQCLLKVLAVLSSPIGISKFNNLLSDLKRERCFSDDIKLTGLKKEDRTRLVKKELVHHDNSGLQLNALLRKPLILECIAEKYVCNCSLRCTLVLMPCCASR